MTRRAWQLEGAVLNLEATQPVAQAGLVISERRGRLPGAWPFGAATVASLILHGVVLALLATMPMRLLQPTAPIPVTLINPAPPPPPPGVAVAVPAPVEVAQAGPQRRREKIVHQPARLRVKRKPRRVRQEQEAAVAPVTVPQTESAAKEVGAPGGVKGGVAGGVRGGQVGGIVGGQGDQPWRADAVATPVVVISRPLPHYPPLARARGIEGLVVLEGIVDRHGRVEQDGLKVLQSVPALDDAAISAFRHWRFRPGRDRDGVPVRVVLQVPIRFRLTDSVD